MDCLNRAFDGPEVILANVMKKARFWEFHRDQTFNELQRLVINRLLDGFQGKLTNSKWATLAKTSSDTALRDITRLVERRILVRDSGGGRSTSYSLAPSSSYILRAMAAYAHEHSEKFVRNGPNMLSAEMTAAKRQVIEAVAAKIDALADAADGRVAATAFEKLRQQLHELGFYLRDDHIAALAMELAK